MQPRHSNPKGPFVMVKLDMETINKELNKITQIGIQSQIKADLDKIDYLRNLQKQVMDDGDKSLIVRSWTANKLEEQIEELKGHIKDLVNKY